MSSICAEHHQYHSHPLFSPQKTLQDFNIPPRKLLSRKSKLPISISPHETFHHYINENPKSEICNFLPKNCGNEDNGDEEEELDPYASDEFRMYEFKVRRCMRNRSHDWTDCPFAHPGEKARRRDPRRFHYSGNPCSDFRRGSCPRGDSCEFAHGVFECWLHPARYRTHACKDGGNCRRKVCFFAHTPREIRVLPSVSQSSSSPPPSISISPSGSKHCCVFCHSVASSPTSTLMGFTHSSPPTLSPPLSPSTNVSSSDVLKGGFSIISRFNEASTNVNSILPNQSLIGYLSYKNALMELVSTLEAIDLSAAASPTSVNGNLFNGGDGGGVSPNFEDQRQFLLSPSTSNPTGSRDFFNEDCLINNGGSCPDLEWINELVR